jgi:hypothetical protein
MKTNIKWFFIMKRLSQGATTSVRFQQRKEVAITLFDISGLVKMVDK